MRRGLRGKRCKCNVPGHGTRCILAQEIAADQSGYNRHRDHDERMDWIGQWPDVWLQIGLDEESGFEAMA